MVYFKKLRIKSNMTKENIIQEDINQILLADIPWKNIIGKTFLISGANGFLPAYIIHTINKLNQQNSKKSKIIALVRDKKMAEKKFHQYLECNEFQLIKQDVNDEINIKEKIDFVIHAASQASPKYYNADPVGTLLPNVIGTKNLLELARKHNVEGFLFFSSGEIYGQTDKERISENDVGKVDPLNIRSCYAESKRMGENMCISWNKQYNIPTKIARIFHTYGPGMKLDDGRVFVDFVADVVKGRNITIKSDGMAKRPFCYISDATIAFFLILTKGKNAEAYNISNPNCIVNINELANIVSKLFPEKRTKIEYKEIPPENEYMKSAINSHVPDITKMKKLKWKPKVTIREGFLRTIKSYL
jgi:UDP-glucuronate decarboxylase